MNYPTPNPEPYKSSDPTNPIEEVQDEQSPKLVDKSEYLEPVLPENYSDLKHRVEGLEEKNQKFEEDLNQTNQSLNQTNQSLNQTNQSLNQTNQSLNQAIQSLNQAIQKIRELEESNGNLKQQVQEREKKYIALETEFLREGTNKGNEYDSHSQKPQQYVVINNFVNLRNNDFRDVADTIFDLGNHSTDERDKIVDRIVSILAEEILIKQSKYLKEEQSLIKAPDIIKAIKNQLHEKKLLEKKILGGYGELDKELKDLIGKVNGLISDMAQSEIESNFVWDQKSKNYDPDLHYLRYGKEENKIIFDIFPGYARQGKIVEKVWISTENLENI